MSTIVHARNLRRRLSPPEAKLWNALRMGDCATWHFRRQVPIGPYFADFASHRARFIIEVDGAQHFTDAAIAADAHRTSFLQSRGYRVLRFTTPEILGRIDNVVAAILAAL